MLICELTYDDIYCMMVVYQNLHRTRHKWSWIAPMRHKCVPPHPARLRPNPKTLQNPKTPATCLPPSFPIHIGPKPLTALGFVSPNLYGFTLAPKPLTALRFVSANLPWFATTFKALWPLRFVSPNLSRFAHPQRPCAWKLCIYVYS